MKTVLRLLFWLLFTAAVIPAYAQAVFQADSAILQPLISRDDIGFKACGVRAVVITVNTKKTDAYDFSLMIYADTPYGLLKAGKISSPTSKALNGKHSMEAVLPPPIKFWIAEEGEGKAVTPLRVVPAENKGFILEVAEIVPTFSAIMSMIHGNRMQFAVRYKNQQLDEIISFSSTMPEKELSPLMKCFDGVMARLKTEANETKH